VFLVYARAFFFLGVFFFSFSENEFFLYSYSSTCSETEHVTADAQEQHGHQVAARDLQEDS
jgi:hypothetical protein